MKRYKVWAVGEDATRQRTELLQRGCLEREDGAILLVRTGSSDDGSPLDAWEVGAFDGTASEIAMLACERTGYAGAVVIKDFGREKAWGDTSTADEEWHHGRASADGATVARGRR